MQENEIKDVQDVEYTDLETGNIHNLKGKVLYYSTKQVADILGEPDSKIRYYSVFFDDILKIKRSNNQRQYTESDIDKLKFMVELKNDGMTLSQIKTYCQEVNFDENKPVVKESNPLGIQAIAKALMEEQTKQLSQFKEDLKNEIIETMKYEVLDRLEIFYDDKRQFELDGFETLKSDIEKRINNTVKEELDGIDDKIKRELDIAVEDIKRTLEVKYIPRDEIEQFGKKESWFSRLFK